MADASSNPPRVRLTNNLPPLVEDGTTTTSSPARGAEMRNFLQARLQKNRAPPLVHAWDFYHDRQDRTHSTNLSNAAATTNNPQTSPSEHPPTDASTTTNTTTNEPKPPTPYEARLEHLAIIDDVRKFWNVFNNFPLTALSLRDSIHLFHKDIKPLWEHPRNLHGGSWTFRVPKPHAEAFWRDICLMAIGEQLQQAVEEPGRERFQDDVCGVSLGVRFNSVLVQVWNRDGGHEEGIRRVLETVLAGLAEELRPREGGYYYKRHREHAGFSGEVGVEGAEGREAARMDRQLQHGGSIDAGLGRGGS